MYILSEYVALVVLTFVVVAVLFLALTVALVLITVIQDLIESCRKIATNVFQGPAQMFRLVLSWMKCAGRRVLLSPHAGLSPCWPRITGG